MTLREWFEFVVVIALGIALVQFSHGKFKGLQRKYAFSLEFLKIIRYMGLFVIVYSSYGVMITFLIAS